ncbi:efflux RND transporter permease subunit [Phaeocystidibacter marisrubri]|uniref:Efflux RND transporter permease subunit n=1 Tax=Phaeocystidibacter marisrubri TaxID=1577780 RepID=A0A6L3ZFA0_9FLAO|nr:efflux RND transporter permease subunit [Phaeocystidibacter marisrubri]KAB2816453.1 efflux RND transporter permease subunit [Phaeocystidibacter marisrubri]GGH69132.1 multidrug ABC transporter [Phaeocystidibacter marisrubri]
MKMTKISIKRPTLVVVLFTLLTGLGLFSYSMLNYELLPDMSTPVLTISTVYPGAAPKEVENSVTVEIEDAVSTLEGVDRVSSTSLENVSIVTVELMQDMDVDQALQEATRKINAIMNELPDDVEQPSIGKFDFSDLPIMRIGVAANMAGTELYDLIENQIQPQMAKIPGVAQVNMLGGQAREIRININKNRLETYGLSLLQVSQAIQVANLDFPTGKVKGEESESLIRLAGKYSSLDQIRQLPISYRPDGTVIRIKDVAEVQDTEEDAEIISRVNGENAIGLSIQKQSDANAVEVSELARKIMTDLEESYSEEGLKFTIANDTSEFTLEAADAVIHDLFFAVILVAVVMLLFLHSLRNAVIVMLAVPASIIATFTAMMLLGFSLNLMSLLALSLVVGILVDDAIVVIENIYRHMEMGKSKFQAAYDGIREIGATVISITLVIIAVFVPLSMTGGIVGNLLRQFALTVAISTILSLLVAFTMIPLLASRFSKLSHLKEGSIVTVFIKTFEGWVTGFENAMSNALHWSFSHKILVLGATFVVFIGSFALVGQGFIGSEFVSAGDRGEFTMQVELPKSSTLRQTNLLAQQVERIIGEYPEVERVSSTIGQSSGRMSTTSTPYMAEINVSLVPTEQRATTTQIFSRQLQIELQENVAGAKFKAVPVSLVGGGTDAPIQVILSGTNLDTLISTADKVAGIVSGIAGTAEVETSAEGGSPEIKVEVDRDKMARLGLSLEVVGGTMRTAFNGVQDSKYRDGDNEYEINILLDEFDRQRVEDIAMLTVMNNRGEQIRLDQFASITEGYGPSQLDRRDKLAMVKVTAQVIGRPVGTVGADIEAQMANFDLPSGVAYSMGGDSENQSEAFGGLAVALLSSLILVYLIMVALYDSYVYPLVVMFSLPLAVIGALLALALSQNALSIFSILGMIMLIGLVAKNAILVVDFTNQLKEAGLEVKAALLKATQVRIRPILMTTLAMVIGMMPIALASGPGAEWKNGLAWVLIGGLTSSMFLTLVVVPVVYYIFDRIMAKFGWDKKEEFDLVDTPREELNTEIEEVMA